MRAFAATVMLSCAIYGGFLVDSEDFPENGIHSVQVVPPPLTYKNSYNTSNAMERKKAKFFGFPIGLVRFENSYCIGLDGLCGTCYTRRQCRDLNGTTSGRCAGNIGYCCILHRTCGAVSSYNNTYFSNQNFPMQQEPGAVCTFTIRKCNSDICQVRIDFLTLTLAWPNATGYCIYDSLQVTGGSSIVRPICGENSGQHIYLGFRGDDDITITISTSSAQSVNRAWYIKVAQIACDCPTTAPEGCLMYYMGLTGTVMSFNYGRTMNSETYPFVPPSGMDNLVNLPGTRELANLNYGVCIKMEPGYCSIEWTATSNTSFAVSGSTPSGSTPTDGCRYDYVIIPNPTPTQTDSSFDRFCGNTFPSPVTSSSKPFVLYVVTDSGEEHGPDIGEAEIGNLGFSLNYRQIPCQATIC